MQTQTISRWTSQGRSSSNQEADQVKAIVNNVMTKELKFKTVNVKQSKYIRLWTSQYNLNHQYKIKRPEKLFDEFNQIYTNANIGFRSYINPEIIIGVCIEFKHTNRKAKRAESTYRSVSNSINSKQLKCTKEINDWQKNAESIIQSQSQASNFKNPKLDRRDEALI